MQYPKTTIALLGALAIIVLGTYFQEIFHTILVEKILDSIARNIFDTERSKMLSYLDPYIVPFCIVSIVALAAFSFGRLERSQTSPLQISYNPNDPRHVERMRDGDSTRYYLEIFNRSYDRSVADLTVVWDKTPLTSYIDIAIDRYALLSDTSIAPRERRRIYLLGVEDAILSVSVADSVLHQSSHFVVRARGKDAAEITATFEFSPLRFPKLLQVS
jgi:hypothetical protein